MIYSLYWVLDTQARKVVYFVNMKTKKVFYFGFLFTLFLAGCIPSQIQVDQAPQAAAEVLPTGTLRAVVTATAPVMERPTATAVNKTAAVPVINPLTGQPAETAALLNRRPVIIKVENLPRNHRPQYGLSFADLVYEYHTEEGTTRYAGVFYGRNSVKVGPVRSGRWFDINLIQMYKAIFIFGSAYEKLLTHLFNADFADRLILEGPATSAALQRYDPNGKNLLLVNLDRLPEIISSYRIDNSVQVLDGMHFDTKLPEQGKSASQIYVRYSGAIYNRWDYDPASGRYQRFVDAQDDVNRNHEVYTPMLDQQTGQPIAADNVVMILARNFIIDPNVYNVDLSGSGDAYLAREGLIFKVKWQRLTDESILTLVDEQGGPVPFKPGTTWFEILSSPTPISQPGEGIWRFSFVMPE
jgi:hypothetical protein